MKAILITGSVGDAITIESLMTNDERQNINHIFYATRASMPCIELFANLPTFPNLKIQTLLWKNFTNIFAFNSKEHLIDKMCAYQPNELQITIKKLTSHLEDWSISKIFDKRRKYSYSSFVRLNLANINKFNIPENYYCICPYSGNDKRNPYRDYNKLDWDNTINILKSREMRGVVINKGDEYIPENQILLNLNAKTTIREAIEILKKAKGYIGIDTAFAVIAAKIFNSPNIIIKSINDHCYRCANFYFAPQETFNFINTEIKAQ